MVALLQLGVSLAHSLDTLSGWLGKMRGNRAE